MVARVLGPWNSEVFLDHMHFRSDLYMCVAKKNEDGPGK
jgi:hypothetical protein